MATGPTDAYEAAILDDFFRSPGTGTARTLYLALFKNTGTAGANDGLTVTEAGVIPANLAEVSAGGYTRLACATADFAAATGGAPSVKNLSATKTWAAAGAFGEIVSWALCLVSTVGDTTATNFVLVGPITTSGGAVTRVTVNIGDTFGFDATNPIKFQLGDPTDTYA